MRLRLAFALTATLMPLAARADGFTTSLVLDARAHDVPEGAPTLVAHAGPSFDPSRPFSVVLFLHGWNGCVNVLVRSGSVSCRPTERPMEGWDLARAFEAADENALLLVPQLAYRARDGRPGALTRAGFARRMIDEALMALGARVAHRRVGDVPRVVVVAHSAGFMAALAIMRHGGLGDALERVVLMDALYDATGAFAAWVEAAPHRSLVSLHTGGRTARNDAALVTRARRTLPSALAVDPPDLAEAIARMRVVVARTRDGHAHVPARYFPHVLGARAR